MRVSCLPLLGVHQVTGIGMVTFSSDLKMNRMKRVPGGMSGAAMAGQGSMSGAGTGGPGSMSGAGTGGPGGMSGAGTAGPGGMSGAGTPGPGGMSGAGTAGPGTHSGPGPSKVAQGEKERRERTAGHGDKDGEKTLFINMGGKERRDGSKETGDRALRFRPEAVHSEVCDTSLKSKVCTACASETECWHGAAPDNLAINVPRDKGGFEYVASIWASCTKDQKDGYWEVVVAGLQNANFGVSLNGKAVTRSNDGRDDEHYRMTSDEIGENSRIKIILSPKDSAAEANAIITIFTEASKWVDTCMDRNYCLKKLGDGSAEAFELRNSNRRQYECLLGNPKASLATECSLWQGCFDGQSGTNHGTELLQLLKAVFEKASTDLVETKPLEEIQDEEDCVDPETADPESAECECFENTKAQCDADGVTDTEECFTAHLCGNENICQSWKTEAGCSGALLMRRGSRRSSMATAANGTRNSMAITAHGTLDGSVTGKCSSETQ